MNSAVSILSGDLIVASIRGGSAAGVYTVSDNLNAGNYTQALLQQDSGNGRTLGIFYMPNSTVAASGALTITVTVSTAQPLACNGIVYTGAATTNVLDQTNSSIFNSGTSTPSSGNITTTVSGDVLVGSVLLDSSATVTVSSESTGFTQELNDTLGTASHLHLHTAQDILSGTSTIAYSPTLSGPITGVIGIASFKPAVAGVTEGTVFRGPSVISGPTVAHEKMR